MRRITPAVAILLFAAIAGIAQAQQRAPTSGGATGGGSMSQGANMGGTSATSGSSGMFGSRNLGGSLSAGNRGFAGGGTGAAGVASTRGSGRTLQASDAGQGVAGNERFTRGGRQAGQFVGADTTDLPSFLTQLATGGNGGNNQLRGGRNQQGRGGQNANQQGGRNNGGRMGQQKAQYRIARSIGFDYAPPTAAAVQSHLGTRLKSLASVKSLGPIDVSFQARTVVLRGSVATAHDRDLAERLALLEAGVDQVQNELTIGQPPASSAPSPTAGN